MQWTAEGSVFGAVSLLFVCVWNISRTAERICAKFSQKMCFVPCSFDFEGQGQRSRSPGTKTTFFSCVRFVFDKTSFLVKHLWPLHFFIHLLQKRNFRDKWHSFCMGRIPLLSPNQRFCDAMKLEALQQLKQYQFSTLKEKENLCQLA